MYSRYESFIIYVIRNIFSFCGLSLSLVGFFVLKSILSDTGIAILSYGSCLHDTCVPSFVFNLFVSLSFKYVSFRDHIFVCVYFILEGEQLLPLN